MKPPFGYVSSEARGDRAFLRSYPLHYRLRRQYKLARWSGQGRLSALVAVARTQK